MSTPTPTTPTGPTASGAAASAAVWVVEGDDGQVIELDPDTGKPWTRDNAIRQAHWARRHGQTVYAYPHPAPPPDPA